MNIDPKIIARLLNYGQVQESENPYDVTFDTPASRGDAADHNQVNGMGDNPMKDPSIKEDVAITPIMLSKLNHLLNGIGIQDSDIAMGDVDLDADKAVMILKNVTGETLNGAAAQGKIAGMIAQLGDRLMGKDEPQVNTTATQQTSQLDEFQDIPYGSRFSYVIDSLGNVNIYDGDAGTAVNLTGEDAMQAIAELQAAGDDDDAIQQVLAQYQHVMENGIVGDESEIDEGPEVDQIVTQLEAIQAQLKHVVENATAVPSNNVHDWYKQNMVQNELEPALEAVNRVLAQLKG